MTAHQRQDSDQLALFGPGAGVGKRLSSREITAALELQSPPPAPSNIAPAPVWSPCKSYRYTAGHTWAPTRVPYLVVIGFNARPLDEQADDPRVHCYSELARRERCNALVLVNLFAFCAVNPRDIKAAADPVGPECDPWIVKVCRSARVVVAGWGQAGGYRDRSTAVELLLADAKVPLKCLGYLPNGQPVEPFGARPQTPLQPFGIGAVR